VTGDPPDAQERMARAVEGTHLTALRLWHELDRMLGVCGADNFPCQTHPSKA